MLLFTVLTGEEAIPSHPDGDGQMTTLCITSAPSHAEVALKGRYTVVGQTPLTVSHLLPGTYRITVSKSRFERFRSTRTFLSGQSYQLSVSLSPKTTAKAALRSLVFPGWGQLYSEKKTRGLAIAGTEILLMSGWLLTHLWYESAHDDYEQYRERFEKASVVKEKEILYNRMLDRLDDAETWDRWRDGLLWAATAVWAYNILDAILFFPRGGEEPVLGMARSRHVTFSAGSILGCPGLRFTIAP